MDDDVNTPNAVAALQKLRGDANKALDAGCLLRCGMLCGMSFVRWVWCWGCFSRTVGSSVVWVQIPPAVCQRKSLSDRKSLTKLLPTGCQTIKTQVGGRIRNRSWHPRHYHRGPAGWHQSMETITPDVIYGLHAVRSHSVPGPALSGCSFGDGSAVQNASLRLRRQRIPVYVQTTRCFRSTCSLGHHQGVVGLVAAKSYSDRMPFCKPDALGSTVRAARRRRRSSQSQGDCTGAAETSGVQGFIPGTPLQWG